jgi:hypothetical protein
MAASPVCLSPLSARNRAQRHPLILTPRRLAANRRNAARSTGPRTAAGKAQVARNAVKHGYFAAPARWTAEEQRDFEETLAGLREDFRPHDAMENACVATIAEAYVRMAAMLRYENLAALKYHRDCEREMDARIAAANADEAARLTAQREQLRRAGLWGPTIPGPREARAICRYQGRLDQAIRDATANLEGLRAMRKTASSGILSASRRTSDGAVVKAENAKTNPLSSMFTGNRYQRRRAEAVRRRRSNSGSYRRRPTPLAPFT